MNSLKNGEGVPLLNFERGPGVPLLNFEGGPGVPFLNFEGGPRSQGPNTPGLGVVVPPLQHAHVMNLLLFLILESVNMTFVLICYKNMTIKFSKNVSNSLFVQIVSYCIGKKHLNKYFIQQC